MGYYYYLDCDVSRSAVKAIGAAFFAGKKDCSTRTRAGFINSRIINQSINATDDRFKCMTSLLVG